MAHIDEEQTMEVDEEVEEIECEDEDEDMIVDESAYRLYYPFTTDNPCLSFDIITDCLGNERVAERGGDPITAYIVSGSQTNSDFSDIYIMKLDNMKPFEEIKNEEDAESSDSEDDLDDQPELECLRIKNSGNINRLRSTLFSNQYFVACMNEDKSLNIFNISKHIAALNDSAKMTDFVKNPEATAPSFTSKLKNEGYAVDWHPTDKQGYLLTGDGSGVVTVWAPNETNWVNLISFDSLHSQSVEDVQWSPTEPTVFISVSVDKSICISDIRVRNKSMITVADAHSKDINVCNWSKLDSSKLVTGSDDCTIRVWDLKLIQQQASQSFIPGVERYTHLFDFHKKPITSVEWSKHETSVFLATSEDNVTTIWDIDLEADAGEEKQEESEIPVNLLFTHGGQTEVKEAHWHSQIPGLVISTASSGFHVFRTINV